VLVVEEPVVVGGGLDEVVVVAVPGEDVAEDPDAPEEGELGDPPLGTLELGAAGLEELVVVVVPDELVVDDPPVEVVLFGGFATSPL
jgi:hypothetical protein